MSIKQAYLMIVHQTGPAKLKTQAMPGEMVVHQTSIRVNLCLSISHSQAQPRANSKTGPQGQLGLWLSPDTPSYSLLIEDAQPIQYQLLISQEHRSDSQMKLSYRAQSLSWPFCFIDPTHVYSSRRPVGPLITIRTNLFECFCWQGGGMVNEEH